MGEKWFDKFARLKSRASIIDDLEIKLADEKSRAVVLRQKLEAAEGLLKVVRVEIEFLRAEAKDFRAAINRLVSEVGGK